MNSVSGLNPDAELRERRFKKDPLPKPLRLRAAETNAHAPIPRYQVLQPVSIPR